MPRVISEFNVWAESLTSGSLEPGETAIRVLYLPSPSDPSPIGLGTKDEAAELSGRFQVNG
jgi:hypothetical protein